MRLAASTLVCRSAFLGTWRGPTPGCGIVTAMAMPEAVLPEPLLVLPTTDRAAVLARLHRAIASCRRCVTAGYIPEAHPICKGEIGNRVMVVGQAPARYAHERPAPYSGASGRILRAWLATAGFPDDALYQRFYLTSITKCFPGPSTSGKGDRAPTAAEVALCGGHLDGEIAVVRPELVLALGRLAAQTLVGRKPLDDLVGALWEAERAGQRFRVLPLPHPSGVSRWLNDPANQARHARALAMLAELRVAHGL
jgi:uracil-DNA glycosylase family 4